VPIIVAERQACPHDRAAAGPLQQVDFATNLGCPLVDRPEPDPLIAGMARYVEGHTSQSRARPGPTDPALGRLAMWLAEVSAEAETARRAGQPSAARTDRSERLKRVG